MKEILVGVVGLVVGYFAADTQPVTKAINEAIRVGTVRGVDECIEYSSSELLSATVIRDSCTQRFRRPIYESDAATGRAGPRFQGERVLLSGNLENKVPGFVTTWVALSLYVFDAEGGETKYTADLTTWIEPLSSSEFAAELVDAESADIEGLPFCEHGDENPTSCISWTTTAASGVHLK